MKLLLTFVMVCFSVVVRAATPAFQDFNSSQFGTAGNKVVVNTNAPITNMIFKITDSSTGRGIIGQRNVESILWSTSTNGVSTTRLLVAISPIGFIVYTNATILGSVSFGSATNLTLSESGSGERVTSDGVVVMDITANGLSMATNFYGAKIIAVPGGVFYGDGSGLTNLAVLTTNNIFINNVTNNNLTVTNNAFFNFVTVTNNATFNGKVVLNSNVYVGQLIWFTNVMSTITINAAKAFEVLATNNVVSVSGFSGLDSTNALAFTRIITNTASSASPIQVILPAGTLVHSSPYSRTNWATNQMIISGVIYPGATGGTNVTITGF